jgi:hypothetical protein
LDDLDGGCHELFVHRHKVDVKENYPVGSSFRVHRQFTRDIHFVLRQVRRNPSFSVNRGPAARIEL